jgi:hypothetical protein
LLQDADPLAGKLVERGVDIPDLEEDVMQPFAFFVEEFLWTSVESKPNKSLTLKELY